METISNATMQELLDYCDMLEFEIALANTMAAHYLEVLGKGSEALYEGEDYDYV